MTDSSHAERIAAGAARYGEAEFARRCAALVVSGTEEPEFLRYVGGPPAEGVIDGSWPAWWAKSWGARALERVWVDGAAPGVVAGLADDAWRVRMCCARVVAVRELGEPEAVLPLTRDDNWRVREAAAWALGRVAEAEHAGALRELCEDDEPKVADRAFVALGRLSERLDRAI